MTKKDAIWLFLPLMLLCSCGGRPQLVDRRSKDYLHLAVPVQQTYELATQPATISLPVSILVEASVPASHEVIKHVSLTASLVTGSTCAKILHKPTVKHRSLVQKRTAWQSNWEVTFAVAEEHGETLPVSCQIRLDYSSNKKGYHKHKQETVTLEIAQ